jgi:AAA domain
LLYSGFTIGKTTLLVATIGRYVTEALKRGAECRLLVCAPSNHAVSDLAGRFLNSIKDSALSACKAILVGDEDKMLGDERSRQSGVDSNGTNDRLRSIFLYTWTAAVIEGYECIRSHFADSMSATKATFDISHWHKLALDLHQRLAGSLSQLTKALLPVDMMKQATHIHTTLNTNILNKECRRSISDSAEIVIEGLKRLPFDPVKTEVCRNAITSISLGTALSSHSHHFSFCGRPTSSFVPWRVLVELI